MWNLTQEYLIRFQRHIIDWNQRYYPNDAFGAYYPAGMWEYLKTSANDILARGQWSRQLPKSANILGGIEVDRFRYDGDKEHYSNVNVDDPFFPPFENNADQPLGPFLDFVLDQPMTNVGLYGQLASGDLIHEKFSVTAGLRYDRYSFDYHKIYDPGRPTASKSFSRVSPRLALVYLPLENLSFKLMAAKAFRAPSPTELAGAHTFWVASNIEALKPEVITSTEAAGEWNINKFFTWRNNVFRTKFENQIAYSVQNNNLSANIYTLTSAGLESELLFSISDFSGFLNYSYVKRLDEEILDFTIAASPDQLTWDPAHKINFGINYVYESFNVSLSGHYQGAVDRRDSDAGIQPLPYGVGISLDMDKYRGREVNAWFLLDLKAAYSLRKDFELAVVVNNLTDKRYSLIKVGAFPFDYQQEGLRYMLQAKYAF